MSDKTMRGNAVAAVARIYGQNAADVFDTHLTRLDKADECLRKIIAAVTDPRNRADWENRYTDWNKNYAVHFSRVRPTS